MKNPISGNFDWTSLYQKYDKTCKLFDPHTPFLHALGQKPKNDRELYYILIDKVQKEITSDKHIGLGTYEAILYWKLYSQPAATKSICRRIREDIQIQKNIESILQSFPNHLPVTPTKDIQAVQKIYHSMNYHCHSLYGLGSSCALPARSTLLHFHYPTIIPIFDKQVLLAVGVKEKDANKKYHILFDYIEFAWDISGNSDIIPQGWKETPLRLLDMALWVIRGTRK